MKYIIFSDVHDDTSSFEYLPYEKDAGYIFLGDLYEFSADALKANIEKLIDIKENFPFFCVYGTHEKPLVDEPGSNMLEKWKEIAEKRVLKAEKALKNGNARDWEFYKTSVERLNLLCEKTLEVRRILENSDPKYINFLNSMKRTDSFPYGDGRLIQIVHDYLPVPAEVKKKLARSRGIGIFNKKTAKFQFDSSPEFFGDILIIGHFHVPAYYVKNGDDVDMKRFKTDGSVELCKEKRYILNPGALKKLKQYRNMEVNGEYVRREARSYAILDTENNIFEVRIIYC